MSKIHVGIVRKVGQPNYGSVGAECRIEVEIDCNPVDSPHDDISYRIQRAFDTCRREVDRELRSASTVESLATTTPPTALLPSNGQVQTNGNVTRQSQPTQRVRPATDAQIRAIHAIASKANIRLASQLTDDFGVGSPQQLTIRQASDLIGKLKAQLPAT